MRRTEFQEESVTGNENSATGDLHGESDTVGSSIRIRRMHNSTVSSTEVALLDEKRIKREQYAKDGDDDQAYLGRHDRLLSRRSTSSMDTRESDETSVESQTPRKMDKSIRTRNMLRRHSTPISSTTASPLNELSLFDDTSTIDSRDTGAGVKSSGFRRKLLTFINSSSQIDFQDPTTLWTTESIASVGASYHTAETPLSSTATDKTHIWSIHRSPTVGYESITRAHTMRNSAVSGTGSTLLAIEQWLQHNSSFGDGDDTPRQEPMLLLDMQTYHLRDQSIAAQMSSPTSIHEGEGISSTPRPLKRTIKSIRFGDEETRHRYLIPSSNPSPSNSGFPLFDDASTIDSHDTGAGIKPSGFRRKLLTFLNSSSQVDFQDPTTLWTTESIASVGASYYTAETPVSSTATDTPHLWSAQRSPNVGNEESRSDPLSGDSDLIDGILLAHGTQSSILSSIEPNGVAVEKWRQHHLHTTSGEVSPRRAQIPLLGMQMYHLYDASVAPKSQSTTHIQEDDEVSLESQTSERTHKGLQFGDEDARRLHPQPGEANDDSVFLPNSYGGIGSDSDTTTKTTVPGQRSTPLLK